nr:DNA polymerase III subunit gamma/tau C-terminal domain-containing protein [Halomonas azerica]
MPVESASSEPAPAERVAVESAPPWDAGEKAEEAAESGAPSEPNLAQPIIEAGVAKTDIVESDLAERASAEPDEAAETGTAGTETAEQSASEQAGSEDSSYLDHSRWLALFDSLGLGGLTRNLAAHCQCGHDDGHTLVLLLAPSQAAMRAEIHQQRIAKALQAQGVERQVVFEVQALDPALETPQQRDQRIAQQRHAEAIDTLNRDPNIQKLQQAFGATLLESSVKPASASR